MKRKLFAIIAFVYFITIFNITFANNIFDEQSREIKKIISDNSDGDITSYITSAIEGKKNNKNISEIIKKRLFSDLEQVSNQILSIIVVCLIYTILMNIQNAFKNSSVSKATFLVFFLSIVSITIQNLKNILAYANEIIQRSVNFSEALLPIILSLLASMGYVTYSTVISPKVLFAIVFSSEFIKNIIVPIVNVYLLISIIVNLDNRFNLRRLLNILKSVILWSIVIGLVIFTGVVSVEGFTGATVDNVAAKSIKYTVGNFVPFVGKILADAADTLAGSLSIIKNTSTVAGLLFLILVVGVPLFKILMLSFIFRLTAAVVEIVSDSKFARFLDDYADNILLIFSMVFAAAFLFVVTFASVLFIVQIGR